MKQFLICEFGLNPSKIMTLYDRPSDNFKILSLSEQHEFLQHVGSDLNWKVSPEETPFTRKSNGSVIKRHQSILAITSTSWTPDEDFTPLYNVLDKYNTFALDNDLVNLYLVITGKGPLKSVFEAKIKDQNWQKVKVSFAWLTSTDYPKMIGCADFGISLHQSSSGFDLPMKILDYFGCGVPVLAVNYNCIQELVVPNEFGLIWKDEAELFKHLKIVVEEYGSGDERLSSFRSNIFEHFQKDTWTTNWNSVARPVVYSICGKASKKND
ncbi:hypothetical protein GEMRC1_008751 [Eukaryota sp. GEM-RC1]